MQLGNFRLRNYCGNLSAGVLCHICRDFLQDTFLFLDILSRSKNVAYSHYKFKQSFYILLVSNF